MADHKQYINWLQRKYQKEKKDQEEFEAFRNRVEEAHNKYKAERYRIWIETKEILEKEKLKKKDKK